MRTSDLGPAILVLGVALVLLVRLAPGSFVQVPIVVVAVALGWMLAVAVGARRRGAAGERRHPAAEAGAAGADLRASRQRLAGILEIAEDAIISLDEAQRIVLFNHGAERIFGYTMAEVLGKPLDVLLPERYATSHREHIARFGLSPMATRRMDERAEIIGRRKDGGEFAAEASISKLEIGAEKTFTVFLRDITARKQAEAEILRLNAGLEREVAARTAELRETIEELEAFSYSVSHDLGAPLRAIGGFAAILAQDHAARLEPEARRHLGIIHDNTLKMERLIDDLLAFSRLSRRRLAPVRIDMRQLAASVFEDLKAMNPERQLDVRINDLLPAHGDPAMMRQVFYNLLSNAVKFSRPRPIAAIEVGCRPEGTDNVYSVKDNGVGFDMRYVSKLFGVFRRLHSAEAFEGTGVGLAIVERIVRRHGGRVWAEAAPDAGATFYFTLPRRADAAPASVPPPPVAAP